MSEMKRLLRVLEYVGDAEWIDMCVATRQLQGIQMLPKGVIREVACEVTDVPLQKDVAIWDFRDMTLERTLNHDPFEEQARRRR